jgi:hypothetical protein
MPGSSILTYAVLRTPEIEGVILFSGDGVGHSLKRPNAIMTTQGGSRAQIGECEPAKPDSPAPTRNPDHMLASIRARARWESPGPCPSGRGFRPAAAARWPPTLLRVPVTNVRLTDSGPTLDNAGFIKPMARLSIAISDGIFRDPCHSRPATVASRPAITPKISRCE